MPTLVQSPQADDPHRRPTREQCIADAARVYSTALSQGLARRTNAEPESEGRAA